MPKRVTFLLYFFVFYQNLIEFDVKCDTILKMFFSKKALKQAFWA